MKNFVVLCKQNGRTMLGSPFVYWASGLFLLGMYSVFIRNLLFQMPEANIALSTQKMLDVFWIPIIGFIPLIVPYLFFNRRYIGTFENLFTTTVTPQTWIFSQFFSVYAYYLMLWICAFCLPLLAQNLLHMPTLFPIQITGLLFLSSSSFLCIALAILACSCVRTAIYAVLLSVVWLALGVFGPQLMCRWISQSDTITAFLNFFETLENFTNGVVDSRPLCVHFIGGLLCLFLATTCMERQWLR